MSANPERVVQVKLVLLGEAAVGKSSIVLRFVQNEYQPNKEPTIGAAFLTQKCRLDDRILRYEIWDTAGQERFHSLAPMYYRNAQAAVVVYDVTKASTLDKAKSWIKELQRQANPNIVIALAGNKVDLVPPPSSAGAGDDAEGAEGDADDDEEEAAADAPAPADNVRQVPTEEAAAYAQDAGLLFFETSAKTGNGVMEMFTEIAKKIPLENITSPQSGDAAANAAGRAGAGEPLRLNNDAANRSQRCEC